MKGIACTDHLGNEYNSISAMCKHYGINVATFNDRLKYGWSLKKALSSNDYSIRAECIDHLGNKFSSKEEMCRYHGVKPATFDDRIKHGKSLEEALSKVKESICTDHLGNTYKSETEMCKHYKVERKTYKYRISHGYSQEEALTPEHKNGNVGMECADHLGNHFKNFTSMCKHYGINERVVSKRLSKGLTIEQALSKKHANKPCIDHLGNKYESIAEMLSFYNVNRSTYDSRIRLGWDTRKILTTPTKELTCTDHLGNTYANVTEMCKAYGVNPNRYYRLISNGSSVEEALKTVEEITCTDHFGNVFKSETEMCRYYGITPNLYWSRKRKGLTIEEALKPNTRICTDHLGNEYKSQSEMLKKYGISHQYYSEKIKAGCSLEEVLLKKIYKFKKTQTKDDIKTRKQKIIKQKTPAKNIVITDHLGNEFNTLKEMCDYHGVSYNKYHRRIVKGLSKEEALSPIRKQQHDSEPKNITHRECFDHLGNRFNSERAMCEYYGIKPATFRGRLERGSSLEDALTQKLRDYKGSIECKDHLGNSFSSISEMCNHYGITINRYTGGQKAGWTLEKILTRKMESRKNQSIDYMGNIFESETKMCEYWGITRNAFRIRIKNGWSLKDALTMEMSGKKKCKDHLGNRYNTRVEMAEHYGKSGDLVSDRLKWGWSLRQALIIPQKSANKITIAHNKKALFEANGVQYYAYKCPICGKEYVFTKYDVREHYADHIEKNGGSLSE